MSRYCGNRDVGVNHLVCRITVSPGPRCFCSAGNSTHKLTVSSRSDHGDGDDDDRGLASGASGCLDCQADWDTATLRRCAANAAVQGPLARRLVVVRATSQVDAGSAASSKAIVPDTEVSITETSFGTIELVYAELKPVPCTTYEDAFKLRDAQATEILAQVRSDVTRFRYGDEQHLEEALKRIFRYGQAGGITRRYAYNPFGKRYITFHPYLHPWVRGQGRYCLTLIFEAKNLQLSDFEDRQPKFQSFFGPGVVAEIASSEGEHMYEVRLIGQDPAAASA
ncbi:hypothetical protein M758_UG096100 [Ceratodon purpureus]|nr:hypothetical protein M758_UG096100 [Ceratodon purpureus]